MKNSWRLLRIAGIDIGIHYSWLFIFILVSWLLAQGLFPQQYPGGNILIYWSMGVITALLLFVSVLLHELAHSLVARARGMKVGGITLFLFGGVSNLEEEPEKPKTEFAMAVVGPLTSLGLGFVFWGLAMALAGTPLSFLDIVSGGRLGSPLAVIIGYLSWINFMLAVFNLLPGFPLDGGRVLRSIIWGSTGNLKKATDIAAITGRVFGWAFIVYGVFQVITGNWIGGIWIAFIGWFLSSAANASRREVTLREHFSGVKVKDVMNAQAVSIGPETAVEQVVANIFQRLHGRAVPVCDGDELLGIITIDDVKKVPRDQWPVTRVERVMTRAPLYTVSPEDGLYEAFRMIARNSINQVLVTLDGKCIGLLSRADIIDHLQLSQDLGMSRK